MKWSGVGSGMAVLCAVHCVALPVLAGASCCVHDSPWSSPWVEGSMLGFTAVVGYGTLGSGFRRHRQFLPLVLLTLGFGAMLVSHFKLSGVPATAATLLGALMIVGAQVVNGRCPAVCCSADACHPEMEPQQASPTPTRA